MSYYVFILTWQSLILQLPRALYRVAFGKIVFWKHFLYLYPSLRLSFVYIDFHHKFLRTRWRGIKKHSTYCGATVGPGGEQDNRCSLCWWCSNSTLAVFDISRGHQLSSIGTFHPSLVYTSYFGDSMLQFLQSPFSHIQKQIQSLILCSNWGPNRSFISLHSAMPMDSSLLLRGSILTQPSGFEGFDM